MPKRRDNSGEGVSLFPFMSTLACLIGILTLMISVSMQIRQTQDVGNTEEEKALAAENRDLTKQAKAIQTSIAKLEKDLERDKSTSGQLAKLEDRKASLEKQPAAAGDPAKTDTGLRKTNPLLREEIAAIIKERAELAKRSEELAAELAARKNPPKKSESVELRPAAAGVRMASWLFFVECNSTGIVLLSGSGAPQTVNRDAITNSPAYASFLDEVKQRVTSLGQTVARLKMAMRQEAPTQERIEEEKLRVAQMEKSLEANKAMIAAFFKDYNWGNTQGQKLEIMANANAYRLQLVITPDIAKGGTPTDDLATPGSAYSKAAATILKDFKAVLMFQVATDSFDTYLEARQLADKANIAAGWELKSDPRIVQSIAEPEIRCLEPAPPAKPGQTKPAKPPALKPKLD